MTETMADRARRASVSEVRRVVHLATGAKRLNACNGEDTGAVSRTRSDVSCGACNRILLEEAEREGRPLVIKWLKWKLGIEVFTTKAVCPKCGKTLASRAGLRAHDKRVHPVAAVVS